MKVVASSILGAQTVGILLLTPGNDACICLTGIKKLISAHGEVCLLSLRHKHMCMNATPGLGKLRLCNVKRELYVSRNTLSAEVPKAAYSA